MRNSCKENRNGLSYSQTRYKLIPNPQLAMSRKSLTILFSALFLFSVGEGPDLLSGVTKYDKKAHLLCTTLLYADLLGTCCNILEKSTATPCLSFPIGCMAVKTPNYCCKPTCTGLTHILSKPVGVQTSQRTSRCCWWHTPGYLTCRYLTQPSSHQYTNYLS